MHIIWDWNGTLFDDVQVNCALMDHMLALRGLPPLRGLNHYREIFQFPVENYYRTAGLDLEKEPFPLLAAEYIETYSRASLDCGLFPDALPILDAFRRAGHSQYILSASEAALLEAQLSRLGVKGYFEQIVGQSDAYAAGKIERGRLWLMEQNILLESCVLIGDTDHDAAVAAALGCPCVLVECGHQSRQRLKACGVPVAASLAEAAALLLKEELP